MLYINAKWNTNYFVLGEENPKTLEINSIEPKNPLEIQKGNQLALTSLPEGWSITSRMSDWRASSLTNGMIYLKYTGNTTITLFSNFQTHTPYTVSNKQKLTIELEVTPSINTPSKLEIRVQILKQDNRELTNRVSLALNLTHPQNPLITYAKNPDIVLLSKEQNTAFKNTLECTLLNRFAKTIPSAQLSIELIAWNKAFKKITINQELKNVSIKNWNYKSESHTWSKDISIDGNHLENIKIQGLVLTNTNIAFLEVSFTVSGIKSTQSYHTSAWFNAYGPYNLFLELDTCQQKARNYAFLTTKDQDDFQVNHISPKHTNPPLIPKIRIGENAYQLPPLAGSFSWKKDAIYFPTSYSLQNKENTLYYLIGENGNYQVLTKCIVYLDLITSSSIAPLVFTTKLSDGSYWGMHLESKDFSDWQNLNNANFNNTYLKSANFEKANLENASFENANLSDANLSKTYLNKANLNKANLKNTVLTGVISGEIKGNPSLPTGWKLLKGYLIGKEVNLENVDLKDLDLSGMDLTETNLKNADLTKTNLNNTILTKSNLYGAKLTNADLNKANLNNSILIKSNLCDVNLTNTEITGITSGGIISNKKTTMPSLSKLYNGYILTKGANLENVDLEGADLSNICLSEANLRNANLRNANLANTQLKKAILIEADLTNSILDSTIFKEANLRNANLRNANLANTQLKKAILIEADLTNSILDGTIFEEANLEKAIFEHTNCQNANFNRAYIDHANFVGAILNGNSNLGIITANYANFSLAKIKDTNLGVQNSNGSHSMVFKGTDFSNTLIGNINLESANFNGAILTSSSFLVVGLDKATFKNVNLHEIKSSSAIFGTPDLLPPGWSIKDGAFHYSGNKNE